MINTDLEKAQSLLIQASEARFFGSISFQFKRGAIVLVRQESTMMPSELPSKPNVTTNGRTDHDRNQR